MDSQLDFNQIYYNDDHLAYLYPFAIPYHNSTLTDYFENSVICDIVPKNTSKRISVCSWRLSQKRGISHRIKKELNRDDLIDDYDVAILTPRSPNHKPLLMARNYHGVAWDNAFTEIKKIIKVPQEVRYAIYENHFVAGRDIYQSYVNELLIPVIGYMRDRDVFFADSGYAQKKPKEEVKAYREKTGRKDWPIAPFILERLFSIYIDDKNLKVVNK